MKKRKFCLIAATLLGACVGPLPQVPSVSKSADKFIADALQDVPFDSGPITVLAQEHGDLRSFTLRPCGAGHICGAGRGHVVETPDYWVVKGAYAGRIFYLSAGGDGWIKTKGVLHPIAWN